jgi:glycosyltransferase involved in cell wall biosynthesis
MLSPTMHVITNLTGNAGAEIMLMRLLRVSLEDKIRVVSLIDVSERNQKLANNPRATFTPLHMNSIFDIAGGALKLARIISKEKPRAIMCWMYHAMIVATISVRMSSSDAPIFWNVRQSLDDPRSLSRNTRLALMLGRALSHTPSGIVYNSERALQLHGKYGYDNRKAVVIPNGFDIPQNVSILAKTPKIFGIAGRFHPQKDHDTFFRAVANVAFEFPEALFRAVGHGLTLENSAVSGLLANAGVPSKSIELCGESSDMPEFYRSIDVLVLSSRTEGFPNVVAEAMSYGKPVITTDVGDAAAIVGNAGWVVPPRDAMSLALAIKAALRMSPEKYADCANRAKQRVTSQYELNAIGQQYDRILAPSPT